MDYFRILSVEPPWTEQKPEALREKVQPVSVRGAGAPARRRAGPGRTQAWAQRVSHPQEKRYLHFVWYCSISLRFVKQTIHKDQSYLSIIELLQLL